MCQAERKLDDWPREQIRQLPVYVKVADAIAKGVECPHCKTVIHCRWFIFEDKIRPGIYLCKACSNEFTVSFTRE